MRKIINANILFTRIFSLVLLICLITSQSQIVYAAINTDGSVLNMAEQRRMKEVLNNYEQYMEYVSTYYGLRLDTNYSYELLADTMKSQDNYNKFMIEMGYAIGGYTLSVDDCIQYLATIQMIRSQGMSANLQAMSEFDVTNKLKDYGKDTLGVIVTGIGIPEVSDEVKEVADVAGLCSDTMEILIESKEQAETGLLIAYNFVETKEMLEAVQKNATIPQLKNAANILLEVNDYEYLYYLNNFSNYEEKVGTLGIDSFKLFTGGDFSSWLKDLGCNKLSGVVGGIANYWGAFSFYKDCALLLSDIFIGNELRYLNEVMVLEDISNCLNKAIDKYDPEKQTSDYTKYDQMDEYVSLLQSLCCVRLRGEYCANMIARANGSLFGKFVDKKEYCDEAYQKAYNILENEYDRIGEILIVDDSTVAMTWINKKEEFKDNSGNVATVINICFPSVTSSAISEDAKKAIDTYMYNEANTFLQYSKDELVGNPVSDYRWCNTADFTYQHGYRLDTSIISICMHCSEYYSGAMHPIHGSRGYNFDAKTGEYLEINNIFEDGHTPSEIGNLVSKYAVNASSDDTRNNMQRSWENGKSFIWNMNNKGLVVSFDPYAVDSYAGGYVKSEIPYSELSGIIKEEYIPKDARTQKTGSLLFQNSSKGIDAELNIIYETPEGDGSCIYISSDEIFYDVYIGRLDSDPNGSDRYSNTPYVTLGTLSPNSMVEINVLATTEDAPNIYIEYTLGDGTKIVEVGGITEDGETFFK